MKKLEPEEAVIMLRKNGMDVTVEQVTEILKFLRMLAKMAVSSYLEGRDKVAADSKPSNRSDLSQNP